MKNDLEKIIKHIEDDFEEKLVESAYKKYLLNQIENESEKYLNFIPNELGSWWNNKDNEINIVAYDLKNIVFIDTNWKAKNNTEESYLSLKTKASNFKTTLMKKYIILSSS